jgi:2-(1,2-epoxy-1,2-dihydrophenyl)acetyl-CoA isomerase
MDFVDGVRVSRQDSTAIITLSNPGKRNAFHSAMRARIVGALAEINADAGLRAVVLTGADGHFCAGADVSTIAQRISTHHSSRLQLREVHEFARALYAGPKPVIAAVEGDAFGGGFSVACACDRVFAAHGARFGSAFAKIGIMGDVGLLYTLTRRVGLAKARELLMLATPVGAEEAVSLGIADELAEKGGALAAALAYAQRFAAIPPLAVAYTRAALASGVASLADALRLELDLQPILATSEDCREAIAAFKEKRAAKFNGR